MRFWTFIFLALFSPFLLAAETIVKVTNNTEQPLLVETQSGQIELESYATKSILAITRDFGFSPGSKDVFPIEVQAAEETWQFNIIRHGKFLSSRLETNVADSEGNSADLFQNDMFEHPENLSHNNYQVFARSYLPTGALYDDIHFVIDHKQPKQFALLPESADKMTVATYNTQLMPFYTGVVNKLNHPKTRAALIPRFFHNYDVVVFNELFDRDLREKIITGMSDEYPYHSQVIAEGTSNFLTGGTVLFSRWPIEQSAEHVYSTCDKSDCMADKGVSYTKINKLGKTYHFFATHLQAWENNNARAVRKEQLDELYNFIEQQPIPKTEAVLVMGDLNIDQYRPELNVLKDKLNPYLPKNSGHSCSSDGLTNLMSTDDECMLIDYAVPLKDYALPKEAKMNVFVPRPLNKEAMWSNFDLSDHYPAEAQYVF